MPKSNGYRMAFKVVWFLAFLNGVHCYRFEPNALTLNNFSACPGDEKRHVHLDMTVVPISRNKYTINGIATFDEDLPGPLELQLISKRCDLNTTQCEQFDSMNIRDICKIFDLPDQFWSEFMKHVEPKIMCPFKKGVHKITDALVDVGYLAHLPLQGYTWIFTQRVYRMVKGRQKKRMVFCITFVMTVQRNRPGKNKN